MTFSVVAFDAPSESWGVAVASKFLAVGALVPWGRAGAGAVATQALANLGYGPRGLAMLDEGSSAPEALEQLIVSDDERAHRQAGVVDRAGGAATYTGAECMPWAGGVAGEVPSRAGVVEAGRGFAMQGNILAGPEVVDAMVAAWDLSVSFPERLLACLAAGDRAGGDRRGRQSAALRVWRAGAAYGGELDSAVDVRVDDHGDPVGELARLLELHHLHFDKADPGTLVALEGSVAAAVGEALEQLGFSTADGVEAALTAWAGRENFEERMAPGAIDPLVLEVLRRQARHA